MQSKLEEVKRILTATRGARDVEVYRAGTRAAHRRRHRSRRHRARRPPGARRRGRRSRAPTAASSPPTMWEGERKVDVRVKLPVARRRATPSPSARLEIPVGDGAPAALVARQGARRHGPHADQPRAGRPLPRAQVQHRGARHGLVRRRGAGARASARCKLPEGYYMTWGGEFENQRRAMKRLDGHRADLGAGDLRAALPDVPRGPAGGRRAARRALRDGRRRLRALPHAHRALGLGGGRLHHALRRGGHGRRAPHHLRAPGARAATATTRRTRSSTRSRSGFARC